MRSEHVLLGSMAPCLAHAYSLLCEVFVFSE